MIAEILQAPDSDWEFEDQERAYPLPDAETVRTAARGDGHRAAGRPGHRRVRSCRK